MATVTTLWYVKDWRLITGTDDTAAGMLDSGEFVKVTGTAEPYGEVQTASASRTSS